MSTNYSNGRRAPNVSQYLANLNPSPSAAQDMQSAAANFDLDSDLDFLTNAEFFDFDGFNGNIPADFPAPNAQSQGPRFHMGEFQTYPSSVMPSPTTPATGLQGTYPPQPAHGVQYQAGGNANIGDKRKASTAGISSPIDLEDGSRMAAEEDKRRRNTAASARFRVKKKQREQALEKQAKEMTDKVQSLETKVQQLEMENKWLKELITEKSDAKIFESGPSEKNPADAAERSNGSHTDGVGTKIEV